MEAKKNKNGKAYLTKRILVRAARKGVKEAVTEAFKTQGYIVIAEDGWVVKKYADGHIEKLKELDKVEIKKKIVLD